MFKDTVQVHTAPSGTQYVDIMDILVGGEAFEKVIDEVIRKNNEERAEAKKRTREIRKEKIRIIGSISTVGGVLRINPPKFFFKATYFWGNKDETG